MPQCLASETVESKPHEAFAWAGEQITTTIILIYGQESHFEKGHKRGQKS